MVVICPVCNRSVSSYAGRILAHGIPSVLSSVCAGSGSPCSSISVNSCCS